MTNPTTYAVVADVIGDAAKAFPDAYMHLGYFHCCIFINIFYILIIVCVSGDEVAFGCVDEFPRIKEWMASNGFNSSNHADLTQYYTLKLADISNKYDATFTISVMVFYGMMGWCCRQNNKKMVMWQEAFYNSYVNPSHSRPLPNGSPSFCS